MGLEFDFDRVKNEMRQSIDSAFDTVILQDRQLPKGDWRVQAVRTIYNLCFANVAYNDALDAVAEYCVLGPSVISEMDDIADSAPNDMIRGLKIPIKDTNHGLRSVGTY